MSAEFDWMRDGSADEDDEKDTGKKMYGVVTGRVLPWLPDPLGLGRVAVSIDSLDCLGPIAWARVSAPTAGMFHGNYFIPNPGDNVLVAFANGNVNEPYIVGALWDSISRPPVPLSELQIRTIRTLVGNQIVMTEVPPTVTIQNGPTPPSGAAPQPSPAGPYQTVMLSPAGITISGTNLQIACITSVTIVVGGSIVNIGPQGVSIVSSANIDLAAMGVVTITAGKACNITAPLVKIN